MQTEMIAAMSKWNR